MSTDSEHLLWLLDRLHMHHKENPNFDYMLRFGEIIERVEKAEKIGLYPWGPSPTPPRWERPKPIEFSPAEGGFWYKWEDIEQRHHFVPGPAGQGIRLHAIKFSDGSIFDMVNGWRPNAPHTDAEGRPANCRNRLKAEGKPYPRSGCNHCEASGGVIHCPFERKFECEHPLPGPTETPAPPFESATPKASTISSLLAAILLELRAMQEKFSKLSDMRPSGATEASSSNSKADTTPAPTEVTVLVDTKGARWVFHSQKKGDHPELARVLS